MSCAQAYATLLLDLDPNGYAYCNYSVQCSLHVNYMVSTLKQATQHCELLHLYLHVGLQSIIYIIVQCACTKDNLAA